MALSWSLILSYPTSIIGILGAVLLLTAWIPQTYSAIKTKNVGMRREFILLYLFGSLFLVFHAAFLSDIIFFILNVVATLIATVNLYLSYVYPSQSTKK